MYRGGNTLGARDLGNKHYELGNRLGNVLAVVTDNIHMADDLTTTAVASASDYYPFGLQMDSRTVNEGDYRYGFNGKEKDEPSNEAIWSARKAIGFFTQQIEKKITKVRSQYQQGKLSRDFYNAFMDRINETWNKELELPSNEVDNN
jgi:hypothetical protein